MPPKKLKLDSKQRKITFFSPSATADGNNEESAVNIDGDNDDDDEKATEKRKFQPKWLQIYNWLEHDEKENKMFCRICREHKKSNAMVQGTDNYRTSTLTRHVVGPDHKNAVKAGMERGNMEKAVKKALNNEEKGVIVALKTVYWLAKEGLPLSKYQSLINFLKELQTPCTEFLNVNEHVDYSGYNSATDLLSALSNVLEEQVNMKMQKSPVITILTDESTDIVVHHKLCVNVRVVDPLTLQPSTHFLTDIRLENATGKGIFNAIKSDLESRSISLDKVMGLGTDGASTMTGKIEGLAGHFLRVNPHITNTHCVAHRLALCTEQAAQKIPAMLKYQRTLEMIYYHFKKSPKKIDQLEAVQKVLEEPRLKYREVHQVRWLSFYEALHAVYRTIDSLLTYLQSASEKDPSAVGLKKKIGSELFISITYLMMDVLQPVMKLSLTFQKKDLDIGIVKVAVDECVSSLENIRDDLNPLGKPTFLQSLEEDMKSGSGDFKGHTIDKLQTQTQFKNVKISFIDAILENIASRFPDNELITSLAVLALRPVSFLEDKELSEWGNDSIEAIAKFYGQEQKHSYKNKNEKSTEVFSSKAVVNPIELKIEWQRVKSIVKAEKYPRPSLAAIWSILAEYHRDELPNLIKVATLALTHPVHTADCERSFSSQNQVTTPLRNRISPENCQKLMRIMIEGPPLKCQRPKKEKKEKKDVTSETEFDFVAALLEWRKKDRRIFQLSDC